MKTQKGATLVGSLIAITILSTAFVSLLNLQSSIIKTRFFLKNDNTANLLATEGIEIVRGIYNSTDTILSNGTYQVDYTTSSLSNNNTSSCVIVTSRSTTSNSVVGVGSQTFNTSSNISIVNPDQCDLDISSIGAYTLSSASTGNRIFHRFIKISNSASIPKITSTVVVRNPRGGNLRSYTVTAELYKIN